MFRRCSGPCAVWRRFPTGGAAFAVVVAVLGAAASSRATTTFTYQGQLKRSGVPIHDTCDLTFKLFDAADDGNQVGLEVAATGRSVVNGLFDVELDFGSGQFDGSARWLEVAVACTGDAAPVTLTPRQPLLPAPEAINADALDGLDSSSFLQSIPTPLSLTGSVASAPILRASNSSATSGAAGVVGESTTGSASTFGVWGVSTSSGGIGVLGQHTAPSGAAAGVAGESSSNSTGAAGVYGKVNGLSAANYGVFGETPSSAGRGVYGKTTAVSGTTYGVYGENSSVLGAAVYGFSVSGDGVGARSDATGKSAVNALTTNANGWAIFAKHVSPAGIHPAIQGETASGINGAKGVYGLATNTAGGTFGVYGETAGVTGQGVHGSATSTTGVTFGVQGETSSTTNGATGVAGLATGNSGQTFGVFGQTDSNTGFSVYGLHLGSGRAVFGSSSSGVGVYALTATGANALYAERTANGNRGWIGGINEAVLGESANGTAVVGRTTNGATAVFGQRQANANRGWFGGISEGAWGEATEGNGVVGVTADAAGFGGSFRNDGGGAALFADGLARVRTLEILDGGDLAEPFEVRTAEGTKAQSHEGTKVEAGMVVVIDPANPGALRVSTRAYDRRVAGVVSGANGLSPGMMMKAKPTRRPDDDYPVALTGRVWCWCDATTDTGQGRIEPGDLLTTSETPGHAMKAADSRASHGAVIGKAMTPLDAGRGLVLVLVNLQ